MCRLGRRPADAEAGRHGGGLVPVGAVLAPRPPPEHAHALMYSACRGRSGPSVGAPLSVSLRGAAASGVG
eukprot:3916735-Prymnesium_polylepis.1